MKQVWIGHWSKSSDATIPLKKLGKLLYDSGKAAGWPKDASKYDIDLLSEKDTAVAFDSWAKSKLFDPQVAKTKVGSYAKRRLLFTVWTLEWNSLWNKAIDLAKSNPTDRPGIIGLIGATADVFDAIGESAEGKKLRELLPKIE